jgi:DNA-directed RNA polymerase subunit RPC12/RpoP
MLSASTLATWIRAEYESLPGLKLTREQACRLWSVQGDTCDEALQTLIDEGFLQRTGAGKFVCLPRPRGQSAQAGARDRREMQLRCPHCFRRIVVEPSDGAQGGTSYRCEGCRRLFSFTALSA